MVREHHRCPVCGESVRTDTNTVRCLSCPYVASVDAHIEMLERSDARVIDLSRIRDELQFIEGILATAGVRGYETVSRGILRYVRSLEAETGGVCCVR